MISHVLMVWICWCSSAVLQITISPDVEGLLGFSVRGGSDHGLGIFVCSVDEDSEAYEKGIRVGHVIRKANGVSFERITQENAIEVCLLEYCHISLCSGQQRIH